MTVTRTLTITTIDGAVHTFPADHQAKTYTDDVLSVWRENGWRTDWVASFPMSSVIRWEGGV